MKTEMEEAWTCQEPPGLLTTIEACGGRWGGWGRSSLEDGAWPYGHLDLRLPAPGLGATLAALGLWDYPGWGSSPSAAPVAGAGPAAAPGRHTPPFPGWRGCPARDAAGDKASEGAGLVTQAGGFGQVAGLSHSRREERLPSKDSPTGLCGLRGSARL